LLKSARISQSLSYRIALYEIPIGEKERMNQLILAGAQIYLSSDQHFYEVFQKEDGLQITRRNHFFADTTVMDRYLIAYAGADDKGNVWGQAFDKTNKDKILFEAKIQLDGSYEFNDYLLKPIPSMDIHCVEVEEKGKVWFCGDDGLYRYDSQKAFVYNMDFQALIKEVRSIKKDSLYVGGFRAESQSGLVPEYRYNDNSLRIKFTSPFYFKEEVVEYSYQLIGFDDKWSEWSTSSVKEYTNLSSGSYVFKVKARNVFGHQSRQAQYEFTIGVPWYFSPWGYGVYVVILLTLIYFMIMLFNRRLLSAKQRLERIVRDRTLELVNRQKQIEEEKEKSDKLLLNILPIKIASELKKNGYAKTQYYEQTTVLFADFRSFTYISQVLEPQHLIKELDRRFVYFDDVCLRHNIEKIKTIGDAYMCVSGIPLETKTHAIDMVLAAFEMQAYMKKLAEETTEGHIWELRIGMHTGPIIAGVVGKNKFAYDVWGDTVNTASRVESSSQPGKINISGETYEVVKDFFVCTYRGKHPVKNKGEIDMYFVERIRPELSNDDEGFMINKYFKDKYDQLLAGFDG